MLESEEDSDAQLARDAIDLEASLNDAEASPVVTLVDRILLQAMSVGASDIHVEPQQKGLRLRFRQDGVLQQYVEPLSSRLVPAVTSRFEILADLDNAERRQAQDGRIRRKYRDRVIDFRVNTLPSRFGEKVCLRLLDSGATQLELVKLIDDPDALALVRELGSKPFGMILVTGPTGSGKSTTLYSLLAERNDPGINISTVEDPIEYTLPGITQCQVNRDKGFDFATALRAFMRQDPDVLLVGATRDLETAGNAIISDAILASRGMVQEGILLSNALIRQKVLPEIALNMLAIGDETGEMDKMLSKVAYFYEDEVETMVKALASMLEPAMIVVVGGIVGSILLAMYLPMFTVFDQIK